MHHSGHTRPPSPTLFTLLIFFSFVFLGVAKHNIKFTALVSFKSTVKAALSTFTMHLRTFSASQTETLSSLKPHSRPSPALPHPIYCSVSVDLIPLKGPPTSGDHSVPSLLLGAHSTERVSWSPTVGVGSSFFLRLDNFSFVCMDTFRLTFPAEASGVSTFGYCNSALDVSVQISLQP